MNFNFFFSKFSKAKSVAIAGFGASGVISFYNLVNNTNSHLAISRSNLTIDIFDGSPFFGRGIAYKTTNINHLLNVPAGKMSAFINDSTHFVKWLAENNYQYKETDFVPRSIYGNYLDYLVQKACEIADSKGIKYNFIYKNIHDITKYGKKLFIEGKGYDCCILALGMKLKNNPKNFWYNDNVEDYLNDEEIHIIGAGLTAFDAIVTLQDLHYKGKIIVHSRTGFITLSHASNTAVVSCPLTLDDANLPLSEIFHKFVKAAKAVEKWQSVIDSFRPLTQKFWQNLNDFKKQQFMRHCFRLWNIHRHRCPSQQYQKNEQMIKDGQLKFTTDPIDRSKKVINCSGFDLNYTSELLKNLTANGLIKLDPFGSGIIAINPNLHVVGGLNFGRLFETTAIPEIRTQAAEVAEKICS